MRTEFFIQGGGGPEESADVELSSAPHLLIGRHCYTALGGASDGGMVVSFEWFLLLRLDLCFGMRLDGTNLLLLPTKRTGWLNRKCGGFASKHGELKLAMLILFMR